MAGPPGPAWAVSDWAGGVDAEAAVRQQDALADLAAALGPERLLVAATGVVEPEPERWPPLGQQWRLLARLRGVVRLGWAGLVLSRVLPAPDA